MYLKGRLKIIIYLKLNTWNKSDSLRNFYSKTLLLHSDEAK